LECSGQLDNFLVLIVRSLNPGAFRACRVTPMNGEATDVFGKGVKSGAFVLIAAGDRNAGVGL
jgi:hypothetical protein